MKITISALLFLLLGLNVKSQELRTKHMEVRSMSVNDKINNEILRKTSLAFVWGRGEKGMLLTHFMGNEALSYGELKMLDAKEHKATSKSLSGFTFKFDWYKISEDDKTKKVVPISISIINTPDGEKFVLTVYGNNTIKYSGEITE